MPSQIVNMMLSAAMTTKPINLSARGTYAGRDDYVRESWDRAATCEGVPDFGVIIIGGKRACQ